MLNNFKFSRIESSFILTMIIVFLSEWIQKIGLIRFPEGIRHVAVTLLVTVNWLYYGRKFVLNRKYKNRIILILFFLIIAWFFSAARLFNYILGIGFTFLFVVIFILSSNTRTTNENIFKIFNRIIIFLILMSIIPILEVLNGKESFRWVPTLFREIGAYASVLNIGTIIGISMFIITAKKKYLYVAVFFSIGVFLTILKKTMISNIIVWLFFYAYQSDLKNKMKMFFYSIIFIVIGYFIIGVDIVKNIDENEAYLVSAGVSGHVRLGMYIASYNIASDFFPFGSGMGTFGSLSSIIGQYSPTYFDYEVSNIGANSPEDVAAGHHTLLDTYWPHIFGELGVIGTILFLYLWFFPIRLSFVLLRSSKDPYIKGLSFYITLIIISMSWEGLSLYTPEIPSFVLLHSGLTGLCYYHLKKEILLGGISHI